MGRTAKAGRTTRVTDTHRLLLWLVLVCSITGWLALLLFTYYINPSTTMTFFLFFLLLLIAVTFTLAVPVYSIGWHFFFARSHRMTLQRAFLLSFIFAFALVLNLILRALHSWNLIMAFVIIAAAVVVDILFLARKS